MTCDANWKSASMKPEIHWKHNINNTYKNAERVCSHEHTLSAFLYFSNPILPF